jgi:hypothetical protein
MFEPEEVKLKSFSCMKDMIIACLLLFLGLGASLAQETWRLKNGDYISGIQRFGENEEYLIYEKLGSLHDVDKHTIDYIITDSNFLLFDSVGRAKILRNERIDPNYRRNGSDQQKRVYRDFRMLRNRPPEWKIFDYGSQLGVAGLSSPLVGGVGALTGVIVAYSSDSEVSSAEISNAAMLGYGVGLTSTAIVSISLIGKVGYADPNWLGTSLGGAAGLGIASLTMLAAREYSSDANMPILFLIASAMPATGSLVGYHLELKYKRNKRDPSPVKTSVQTFGNRVGLTMTF